MQQVLVAWNKNWKSKKTKKESEKLLKIPGYCCDMVASGMESPLSKTARRLRESRSKSLLNIQCFDALCTREGLQEFLKLKLPLPHHSQLNGGKFELLSVDDDPINQVDRIQVFCNISPDLFVLPSQDGSRRASYSLGIQNYEGNGWDWSFGDG